MRTAASSVLLIALLVFPAAMRADEPADKPSPKMLADYLKGQAQKHFEARRAEIGSI